MAAKKSLDQNQEVEERKIPELPILRDPGEPIPQSNHRQQPQSGQDVNNRRQPNKSKRSDNIGIVEERKSEPDSRSDEESKPEEQSSEEEKYQRGQVPSVMTDFIRAPNGLSQQHQFSEE